jgi:hypothetical protein
MRPMILKEPAPCCGSPTLLWDKKKWAFVCPCGLMSADELGRKIDHTQPGQRHRTFKRKMNKREYASTDTGSWRSLSRDDFRDWDDALA